jgi:hypothetical protein
VAGTYDLAWITQRGLIQNSDEDAARAEDSVGDWGTCNPHMARTADTVDAMVTFEDERV